MTSQWVAATVIVGYIVFSNIWYALEGCVKNNDVISYIVGTV